MGDVKAPEWEWQTRVRQERAELAEKVTRLQLFVDTSERFADMPGRQQALMTLQLSLMTAYLFMLDERIAEW